MRRDDGCAENFVRAFRGQNFRETGIFALNHCTIDVFQRNDEQVVIDIFLFRFLFGQSDMRDFWIDIRAPRHDRIIYLLPQKLEWNKNVSHNYARLRIGPVCKQEWPDYIAYTVNMPLRRLSIIVNAQTRFIDVNPCGFQVHALQVWVTPDSDKERVGKESPFGQPARLSI